MMDKRNTREAQHFLPQYCSYMYYLLKIHVINYPVLTLDLANPFQVGNETFITLVSAVNELHSHVSAYRPFVELLDSLTASLLLG